MLLLLFHKAETEIVTATVAERSWNVQVSPAMSESSNSIISIMTVTWPTDCVRAPAVYMQMTCSHSGSRSETISL